MEAGDPGGIWTELYAGAAAVCGAALSRIDIPAMIFAIPGTRIIAANEPAAEMFDVPLADMVDQIPWDLARFEDRVRIDATLEALELDGIDGYRARRRAETRAGRTVDFVIWVRSIDFEGARRGVALMRLAAESPYVRHEPEVETLPLEAMAVGTAGPGWVVERISAELRQILGRDPRSVIGQSVLADMHPDDARQLVRNIALAPIEGAVMSQIRLRHVDGSWVRVNCLAVRQSADPEPAVTFAFMPASRVADEPGADRVTQLEKTLRRIAGELQVTGFMDGLEHVPTSSEFPQLASLNNRQWQILVRLMRGDRVPAIARDIFLSPSTVRNYLSGIFSLFGVHSQTELLSHLRKRV